MSVKLFLSHKPWAKYLLLLLPYVLLFYFFAQENFYFGYSVLIGILCFPFLVQVQNNSLQYGYLYACLFLAGLSFFTNSFAVFYFSFAFGCCFLLNLFLGKLNYLPLFLLGLMSPLISHLTAIMSFPIRLKLSEWVSMWLGKIGMDIASEGNMLIIEGAKFLVDQECVGLKMLLTGLTLILIVLAFYERKANRSYTFIQVLFFLALGFVFNILANFSRILLLVMFQIGPEKMMHDIVGIACLLFYNLFPILWIASRIGPRISLGDASTFIDVPVFKQLPFLFLLFGALTFAGMNMRKAPIMISSNFDDTYFQGLDRELLKDNIIKYSNDDLLVYIKPPASPIRGTHDPRFCWRGSGYALKQISETVINGKLVYTGELIKGEDVIFTAWWYQDGEEITASEWTWRTNSILDAKAYSLVNMNASSKEILTKEVTKYLEHLQ